MNGMLLFGLLAVPGSAVVMLLHSRSAMGLFTRAAAALAYGYAMCALTALVLAATGQLRQYTFIAAVGAMTLVGWVAAWRWRRRREPLPMDPSDVLPLFIGFAIIAVFAVAHLRFSPLLNLAVAGMWRYWADALQIASLGHIPSQTYQWGAFYPPAESKTILNVFSAAVTFILPDPLRAMGALGWVAAVGFALSLLAVGREMGLRFCAPLLPLLVLALPQHPFATPLSDDIEHSLDVYRAETTGRMVAFAGLALGLRLLDGRRRRREIVGCGVVFGVAAGTHLIPTLVAAALLMGAAATRLARGPLRRQRALAVAAAAVIGMGVFASALLIAGGTLGLAGASSQSAYRSLGATVDPTASFTPSALRPLHTKDGHWFRTPATLIRRFVKETTGHWDMAAAVTLALLATIGIILVTRPEVVLATAGAMALALLLLIGLSALFFSYHYTYRIPATFPVRRLYLYGALPFLFISLALVELGVASLDRWRAWLPTTVATAVVLAVAVAGLHHVAPLRDSRSRVVNGRIAALNSVREELPCDARLLVDGRSSGIVQVMTGRISLLEGQAPYLRPDMLSPTLRLLIASRRFFEHPLQHGSLLGSHAVDYVMLYPEAAGGGALAQAAHREALKSDPSLHRRRALPGVLLFRVGGPRRKGVRPGELPGFDCRRGPLD